jgi:hypothetical protein
MNSVLNVKLLAIRCTRSVAGRIICGAFYMLFCRIDINQQLKNRELPTCWRAEFAVKKFAYRESLVLIFRLNGAS